MKMIKPLLTPSKAREYIQGRFTINKISKCHEWCKVDKINGYGHAYISNNTIKAHRLSYYAHTGTDPFGMQVCHKCDNPSCINPDHLFLGTSKDNMNDMRMKGRDKNTPAYRNRNKTHCPKGHEYSKENTIIMSSGNRTCRICRRDMHRRKYAEIRNIDISEILPHQRDRTHCIHGHEFNTNNTYVYIENGKSKRKCKQCMSKRSAEYYRRLYKTGIERSTPSEAVVSACELTGENTMQKRKED